jgi:thymidylate synthase (FAD)
MNVKLIGFTPDPEKIPAMAAKLTHSKIKPEDLDKTSDEELTNILQYVMDLGHTSVIEHTSFTFAISDVSRSLTHQLVRHRIASYAQQSQRYVDFKKPNYVIPPTIVKNKKMNKAYNDTMTLIWKQYNKLLEIGIPAEDSRFILPNAACTNIMVTMNARSLLNFFELR